MSITLTHNTRHAAEVVAKVPEIALPKLDAALGRGSIEIADQAKEDAPKYRTELTNSIQLRASFLEHTIVANAGHALYVEEGTGPGGWPKLEEMIAWIKLKGIRPRDPGMTVESLAHLIRRDIGLHGIRRQPFFFPALERKRSRLDELVAQATRESIAEAGFV